MAVQKFRNKIDEIDRQIIRIIAKRISAVKEIYYYKKKNKIKIFDSNREKEVLANVRKQASRLKISKRLSEDIFKRLIKESHRIEK